MARRERFAERSAGGVPESFDALVDAVNEASRRCRNILLTFLLVTLYVAIIVGGTSDEDLLRGTAIKMPVLGVGLPITTVYFIVPPLLFLLHLNLLLNLTYLGQKLRPIAVFISDHRGQARARELRRRIDPLPYTQSFLLTGGSRFMRVVLFVFNWTTLYAFPVAVLLWMQVRFIPYHSDLITTSHSIVVLLDVLMFWPFWISVFSRRSVRWWREPFGQVPKPLTALRDAEGRWFTLKERWSEAGRLLGKGRYLATRIKSLIALRDATGRRFTWKERSAAFAQSLRQGFPVAIRVVSILVAVGGSATIIWFSVVHAVVPEGWLERELNAQAWPGNLLDRADAVRETDLGNRLRYLYAREKRLVAVDAPPAVVASMEWRIANGLAPELKELSQIQPLNLSKRDLRGANLTGATLIKADLRGADLRGANLRQANLAAANFGFHLRSKSGKSPTRLSGADLTGAILHAANMEGAILVGADMLKGQLQGAVLSNANLDGADLFSAGLQGAELLYTKLNGAHLGSAELHGAEVANLNVRGAYLGLVELSPQSINICKSLLPVVTLSEQLWSFEKGITPQKRNYDKKGLFNTSCEGGTEIIGDFGSPFEFAFISEASWKYFRRRPDVGRPSDFLAQQEERARIIVKYACDDPYAVAAILKGWRNSTLGLNREDVALRNELEKADCIPEHFWALSRKNG